LVATLFYQTSSKEYIGFRRSNSGPDGQALGDMWENSKSPPVLMAQAYHPLVAIYFPIVN